MLKAIILNSGTGSRMGDLTSDKPKCLTKILHQTSILELQIKHIYKCGVRDLLITTGKYHDDIIDHVKNINLPMNIKYVLNNLYDRTNYIYSLYCIEKDEIWQYDSNDEILLLHGDLVFDDKLLQELINFNGSCMVTNSKEPLPMKDFKAIIRNGIIKEIGVNCFEDAQSAQPLYKLTANDWIDWQKKNSEFCLNNEIDCYAEVALNILLSDNLITLKPLDSDLLCLEIDTIDDLKKVQIKYKKLINMKEV